MKKRILFLCAAALAAPMTAMAGVDVHVNVGVPIPVVPVPVVPVPPPPPSVVLPGPPPALFERPPVFLQPPDLGFYVGVDVPYDIYFAYNYYYLHYRNAWYRSDYYNGPWMLLPHKKYIPKIFRQHSVEYFRVYRDREYQNYYRTRDHYRGRPFMPGRPDLRHDGRPPVPGRDERWNEHEMFKNNLKRGPMDLKDERKMDRRIMKEERKHDREELKHERKMQKEEMKDFRR